MRQLIEERGVKDVAGVQALVKELTAGLIQEIMDAELDDELGYSKYDYKNKQTDNRSYCQIWCMKPSGGVPAGVNPEFCVNL
jgi:transposase-like protein